MDYEQDEHEEPMKEQAAELQTEDKEIDDEDVSYLDLWDDHECQAYAMLKR
jgi:hypothetical protein